MCFYSNIYGTIGVDKIIVNFQNSNIAINIEFNTFQLKSLLKLNTKKRLNQNDEHLHKL